MSSNILLNRREAIVNSYMKRLDDYPNIDLIFYSDDEDPATNTIKVNVPLEMMYRDNEIKTIGAVDLIEKRYYNQYDWYLFTDDDTFVNVPLLNKMVHSFDKTIVHGKDLSGCYGNLSYLSGGAGILISNDVISKLFNMTNYKTDFSDVNIGLNMRERNISIVNNKLFNGSNPYNENKLNIEEEINSHITQHYVNPQMMMEFDSLVL
jgi:hypothetical protein